MRDDRPLCFASCVRKRAALSRRVHSLLPGRSCRLVVGGGVELLAAHKRTSATTIPFRSQEGGLEPPAGANTFCPRGARATQRTKLDAVPPSPPSPGAVYAGATNRDAGLDLVSRKGSQGRPGSCQGPSAPIYTPSLPFSDQIDVITLRACPNIHQFLPQLPGRPSAWPRPLLSLVWAQAPRRPSARPAHLLFCPPHGTGVHPLLLGLIDSCP